MPDPHPLMDTARLLEQALHEKRVMSETLATAVERCTKQESVIREFRRLAQHAVNESESTTTTRALERLLQVTEGGRLP